MTNELIYEYFKDDHNLLDYFDPMSTAKTIEEAANDVYEKILQHGKESDCNFICNSIGYFYYSDYLLFSDRKVLISFCVKKEHRNKEKLKEFWELIHDTIGNHFECYLFNRNERAIQWLIKCGMKIEKKNDLITLLTI